MAGLAILIAVYFQVLEPGGRGAYPRLSANEALLSQQNEKLAELVAAAERGSLLDVEQMLIVVDQTLVQDLLRAVTPLRAEVGGGFHVSIDSVETTFADGVALVSLIGTASAGETAMSAPVRVLGAIDVVAIDPFSGILRCGVSIVGVDAQNPEALGRNDPVGRLTEALTSGGLALLLGPLEIPVKVEDRLSIPAVSSKRLQIMAENLPITVAAKEIKVFNGKLWVSVHVTLRSGPPSIGAKS